MSITFTVDGSTHTVCSHKAASSFLFSQEWINAHAHSEQKQRGDAVETVIRNAAFVNSEHMQGIYIYLYYHLQLISHYLGIKTVTMERMGNRRRYIMLEERKGENMGQTLLQQKEQLEEQAAAQRRQIEEQAATQMQELRRQIEEQAAQILELELSRPMEEPMEERYKKRMRAEEPPKTLTFVPVSQRFHQGRLVHVNMDNKELFSFVIREQRISHFSPDIMDIGQDFSGVIMMNNYVIKLLTEATDGLKFKVGKRAERHQLEDNLRSPDIGYSRCVTKKKIDKEIAAMLEMHELGLGPAMHCNGVFEGKLLLCYTSLRNNIILLP